MCKHSRCNIADETASLPTDTEMMLNSAFLSRCGLNEVLAVAGCGHISSRLSCGFTQVLLLLLSAVILEATLAVYR